MLLWCDGAHGARENMRRDALLLERAAGDDTAETVLRLFTFDPPGITLGHSQEPGRELDLERVGREGIEWAVRPTGGRAIFHQDEWTFSLVTRLGPERWAADAAEAYARSCGLLMRALRTLGVPVELSAGSPRGVGPPRGAGGPAAPCFASTARHELTLGGRKLAGIAQRLVRGALLQQGSLLLGPGHLRLADYLPVAPGRREGVREALGRAAACAGDHLAPGVTLADFAAALARELPGVRLASGEAGRGEGAGS
jgi:lipoate-protein ligase A